MLDMTTSIKLLTKENREIRRANLLLLLRESGDKKQELAEKANTKAAYIGHILTTDLSRRRDIGDKLARKLEQAYGKPNGWMDEKHEIFEQTHRLESAELSNDDVIQLSLQAARDAMKSMNREYNNEEKARAYNLALRIGLQGRVTEAQFKEILIELFG